MVLYALGSFVACKGDGSAKTDGIAWPKDLRKRVRVRSASESTGIRVFPKLE